MSGWAAFWLLCAVYVAAEAVMYLNGHETALWKHKTPAEKAIQAAKVCSQCPCRAAAAPPEGKEPTK